MKLNQVVAIEKSVKNAAKQKLTELHHAVQKPELVTGFTKTFQPANDGGETFPPENKKVSVRVNDALEDAQNQLVKLFDITATKDAANNSAAADVVVDGAVLVSAVPITTLLFLEKQLVDLRTFVLKLPVLDAADEWKFRDDQNLFATEPVSTVKTKKVEKVVVKYEATKEHPAQTEIRPEDVTIGYWKTIKYSGALPATRVKQFLARVEKLQESVKLAREEANNISAPEVHIGKKVFDYVFSA